MIFARNLLAIAGLPLISLAVVSASPALAQSTKAGMDTAGESAASEIIVTARKRDERIVDVPIAITAITGDQLERQGAGGIADFLRQAPVMVALRLFLPESWTGDPARLDAAHVPDDRRKYRTKPEIALAEIDRVREAGVRFGCVLEPA